jgi:methionine-gamma-lyase
MGDLPPPGSGPGGMTAFELRGGEAEPFRFLNALELFRLAVSLGRPESLQGHPATMTHTDMTPEARERTRITPPTVRLSIGVEDSQDPIADLERALASA